MKVITDTLKSPREVVSQYAPKIKVVKIPVDKIGEFIGPGGKNVKKLSADTGCQFDTADDGSVSISGVDPIKMAIAVGYVEGFAKEVMAGEIYDGEVVRIMPFGAFVNILPGKDGMVHVSDMGRDEFVADANDVVKIGDKVKVRVVRIDDMGRINLSMNMDPSKDKPKEDRPPRTGGFSRGPRRDFNGPRRSFSPRGGSSFGRGGPRSNFGPRRDYGNSDRPGESGGPHFPTSRLMGEEKQTFDR